MEQCYYSSKVHFDFFPTSKIIIPVKVPELSVKNRIRSIFLYFQYYRGSISDVSNKLNERN